MDLSMNLIFTKDFFQCGSNQFGVLVHESSGYENFGWLADFLMDDGGMGVKHLLEMSEIRPDHPKATWKQQ